ncbi:MAG: hypothetical protein ABFR05_12350, partial [Bacteroidota bacterium]
MSRIEKFINKCPSQTNLTDCELFRKIENFAENLHEDELDQLDLLLAESPLSTYSAVLVVKLAKSKFALNRLNKNVHITFLFAIY